MTGPALDALTAALASPAAALHEAALHRSRGHRPRQHAPGTGRRPRLTLAVKLLALILRDRHGLPCKATAALPGLRHELTSRYTSDIRPLLRQSATSSSPPPASSPPSATSTATPPPTASPSQPRSKQRVNNRRALSLNPPRK